VSGPKRWIEKLGRADGGWCGAKRWWLAVGAVVVGVLGLWLLVRVLLGPEDRSWDELLKTGVLRVCTDPSWPPFEFVDVDTSQIEGFDIELAGLLVERLAPGGRAEIVTVGFDGLYDALLSGRCDAVLSALPYDPMRTQDVVYSVAYFNAGLVVLTWDGTSDIEELDDLEGRVVGVEWGFVPEGDTHQKDFLRKLGARRYDTAEDVLRALQAGEIEMAIVDRITALVYTGECEGLQFVGEPIYDVNYVLPVRPDSVRLLDEINRVLLEMREDGTLEALQERWF
jgi:ABC-type amino acid transport substrate-binding protein